MFGLPKQTLAAFQRTEKMASIKICLGELVKKHAQNRKSPVRIMAAIAATASLSISTLIAAQASTTFDLNKGTLSFVSAKEKRGSNSLSALLTQATSGPSGGDDIGENFSPGDYADYYGIATLRGQAIDARVTFVSENGSASGSTDGLIDKLDDATSTTSENTRIRTDARWNNTNGGQDWFVEFKIDFYKDLAGVNGNPVPVTLQNIYLSIYDIDNLQFVEISNFNRYYLSSTGSILTPETATGILRLQSSNTATDSSNNTSFTTGRASFEFDATASITIKLGEDFTSSPGSASFELDFGTGEDWTGNARGTAATNNLAANKIVTYAPNGGSGNMGSQGASTTTALNANTLTRTGFTFAGWNTAIDGSGTPYADRSDYSFASDLTLYAQWIAYTLPATTSWTNAGLQQMVSLTGRLTTSVDGFGSVSGAGNLQVEKPSAQAKVVAAFLTLSGTMNTHNLATPSVVTLDGRNVAFSHRATEDSQAFKFRNFFADVTAIVKPTIDAAAAGVIDIAVDEAGVKANIDGSSLIVVFDDPNTGWGSVIVMFGTSRSAGDVFTVQVPALNANELTGHRLSLGIGFSSQISNYVQNSTVNIRTTTNGVQSSSTLLAEYAGGDDDGENANGALITVGGVGDSPNNPVIGATPSGRADDELYSLDNFVSVGVEELEIRTRNASGDDNLFQAVLLFNGVLVSGSSTVSDPSVNSIAGNPVQDRTQAPVSPPAPVSQPALAPYTGPIPTSLSVSCVPAGQASIAVLTGERLNTITSAEVDGKAVAVSEVTATSLKLALPALTAGTHSVIYNSSSGRLTHQDSLRVCASAGAPVTITGGQAPFTITQRFTGYRGDRGPVVARDLRAITAFIKANPGLTSVTCTGSTSGVPAKSTDQALATARATNACNIVKRLVPGVTTSISTITGQGVGQFHRAVIITGQGSRP
jgi:uncharacterized repeat protein (TIGR02543 family)